MIPEKYLLSARLTFDWFLLNYETLDSFKPPYFFTMLWNKDSLVFSPSTTDILELSSFL